MAHFIEDSILSISYLENDTLYEFSELVENSVWASKPQAWGVVVYSMMIPMICSFGIVGNFVILLVLSKKSLKESTYTYLTVLAAADLVTCILLLFSGLARGLFWKKHGWVEFDVFIHIPLCTISSNVAVLAAVGVAIDRLVIVIAPAQCCQPRFCRKPIARKLMGFSILFVAVINIPFFFIYTYDERGNIVSNNLSKSCFYDVLNWFQLVIFGLIPAIFLPISNAIMIFAVKKTMKQRVQLLKCRQSREGKYLCDQSKLTITLVGIVFIFLVGEVPTHLASRRSAVSILYGGDPCKINKHLMEVFRIVATFLNSISCSANFVLYCVLNPRFLAILKSLFRSKRLERDNTVSVRMTTLKNIQTNPSSCTKLESKDCPWKF
ncbi:probable G-protein coupled receptor B0563.6 [Nasonia vitripennis]|uniref:G-protein coupled receptors family 1 profile domain-containing protein n=1 Tax=Nasonia vitripennis TaxID=7425 RepID=A0A7M7GDY4_NASVI|nr:probable G-protein coupled receptor B0563.6 [Nasonia vitripennis]